MPVYGGNRAQRRIKPPKRTKLLRILVENIPLGEERYRRKYLSNRGRRGWKTGNTSLAGVNQFLSPAIGMPLQEWIIQRANKTGRKAIVLDWGCGPGRAISELARETKGRSICIGYSEDSYATWARNKFVSFIQEEHTHFLRYIKQPIDLIYAHAGLWHIQKNYRKEYYADYLSKLAQKLSKGGIMVSYPGRLNYETMRDEPQLEAFLQHAIDPSRKKFSVEIRENRLSVKRLS